MLPLRGVRSAQVISLDEDRAQAVRNSLRCEMHQHAGNRMLVLQPHVLMSCRLSPLLARLMHNLW